jgi:hypothetical protein
MQQAYKMSRNLALEVNTTAGVNKFSKKMHLKIADARFVT